MEWSQLVNGKVNFSKFILLIFRYLRLVFDMGFGAMLFFT